MNVDAFLHVLSNTSRFLRETGASKSADLLQDACEILQPFRGQKLEAIVNEIEKAKSIIANAGARKQSTTIDSNQARALLSGLEELYRKAGVPNGTNRTEIETVFANPLLEALSVKDLKETAAKFHVSKGRSKPQILMAMKKSALSRMGEWARDEV